MSSEDLERYESEMMTLSRPSAMTRARPARNFSPFDSALYGRSQAGTLPRPTADMAPVTSSKLPAGAMDSTMGLSAGQPWSPS